MAPNERSSSGAPVTDTAAAPDETVPTVMHRSGQTEQYVLQAAALRRRQLRAAFLYGSQRSWRQRQALWPGALAGVIVVAVIVAVIAVTGAFEKQKRINEKEQRPVSTQTS